MVSSLGLAGSTRVHVCRRKWAGWLGSTCDALGVACDRGPGTGTGHECRVTGSLVLKDDVQSVDDAGNVTENGEEDVDAEVSTAAALEEDTDGREDDGKNDLADVAGGERHVGWCCGGDESGCCGCCGDCRGVFVDEDWLFRS